MDVYEDVYEDEYDQFQRDVHVLIRGTLNASIRYLDAEMKTQLADIEAAMKKPLEDEYYEHLVGEHADVLDRNSSQKQFVGNMALVALASRLTHALRAMARSAESFSPRKKRYGDTSMSEFHRLWNEYKERFEIDFSANADRIAFADTMNGVRNQIVHAGGEANPFKGQDDLHWDSGEAGYLDMRFSEKYPEYVSGTGMSAEVSVSEEQLGKAIKSSVGLVGWLAGELRKRELSSINKP